MHDRGHDRVDELEGRQHQPADDKEHAEEKILVDDGSSLAREPHQERQAAQVVVHERDRGAVDGHLAARRAHGNAQISRRQGGRVVDTVPNHRDPIAFGFDGADKLHFILRQAIADHLLAADFRGDPQGHRLAVARDHGDAPHAQMLEIGQGLASFSPGLILEAHPANALPVARRKNQTEPLGLIQIHPFQETGRHPVILEPLGAPHEDGRAFDLGFDAPPGGLRKIFRLRERNARLAGELDQGFGGGMVAVLFRGRGQAEQLGGLGPIEGREAAHRQLARGERAGLVEDERVDSGGQLDISHVLDQDAEACRRGQCGHHGGGRGQDKGAGAGHDEHRDHAAQVLSKGPDQSADDQDQRGVEDHVLVHDPHDGQLGLLRRQNQIAHLAESGVVPRARDFDFQNAG